MEANKNIRMVLLPRALFWGGLVVLGMLLLLAAAGSRPATAEWPGNRVAAAAPPVRTVPRAGQPSAPRAGLQYHRVVATIPLTPGIGRNPVAIAPDPYGPLVYVANAGSRDITVLSGTTVLGMVAGVNEGTMPDYGIRVEVHPSSHILFAVEDMLESPYNKAIHMQVVSSTAVITTVQVGGCSIQGGGCGTTDMAFQPTTGYLYLLTWYQSHDLLPLWGQVGIWEGTTEIASLGFEDVLPRFVATDRQRGYVYVTADFTLTDAVLVMSGTTLLGTVPVTGAGLIEVQSRTGLAYVQSAEHLAMVSGTASMGDLAVGDVAALAADPASGYLYVSHPHTPTVTVVSGTAVLTEVEVISPAGRIEVDPTTGLVYLRHPDASFLTVLSGTAVLTRVEVLSSSSLIAANPNTGLVYTADGPSSMAVLAGVSRLATIPPAAPQPQAMERHPRTGQIVVLSSPPALTWIQDQAIVATTALTATPAQMLIHPTSGLIYLTLPAESAVLVLSGTTLLVTVPTESPPTDIAVQPRTGLVYVPGYDDTLDVLSGTVRVATLYRGGHGQARVAAHAGNGLVYVTDLWSQAVHVFSGTQAVTDVALYAPYDVSVEPQSGYTYVAAGGGKLWVLSATTVITSIDLGAFNVVDMQPAPASGDLYLHLGVRGVYVGWDQIGIVRGTGQPTMWPLPWPSNVLFSTLEPHPAMSYLYAGRAGYGSILSVGVGATLVETLTVGDGSWVRAIAVDPAAERVYVATDHAIAVLEVEAPYRFFFPWIQVGPRTKGGELR